MPSKPEISVFWFRRDLRLDDNHGLFRALQGMAPVLPVYIFDKDVLDDLPSSTDKRQVFIHRMLGQLSGELQEKGSSLLILHKTPEKAFEMLTRMYEIKGVYANYGPDPYDRVRDESIEWFLKDRNIPFYRYIDHVIFGADDVLKKDGKPYTVFTAYANAWKATIRQVTIETYPSEIHLYNLIKTLPFPFPALEEIRLNNAEIDVPPATIPIDVIKKYDTIRDFPSVCGTSRLGVHFRYGTISIRHAVKSALELNETWLNELIWREFFMMILQQFPHVTHSCFHSKYNHMAWRNNESEFKKWCNGETGYTIVDAGMHELNETGFMHNRVRMITASFLTKHLLIDWRWGEAYFEEKLLDHELAANNGNWQWVAGTGCDAAPYFRVFNPELQAKRFDPKNKYQERWLGDLKKYSVPRMVNHQEARERALKAYGAVNQDTKGYNSPPRTSPAN